VRYARAWACPVSSPHFSRKNHGRMEEKRKKRRDGVKCDTKCNGVGSADVWVGAVRRSTTHATGREAGE
jgi:hypothetical protein